MPGGRGGSGVYEANMVDRELGVKPFSYTDETLDELETALSRARLSTYLDAAGGDRERAIRLHAWNTAVGAAFYGPLQGLEVVLRNAMHRRLAACYGPAWYDHPGAGLDRGAVVRVAGARSELARDEQREAPTRIVAMLSFGFWVSLLGPGGRTRDGHKANYEMTLWRPALRGAFVHRVKLTRRQAHHPLNALRILRNRVAHHQPIFARDLAADHERILDVAGWISPAIRTWIEHHSRAPAAIEAARDADGTRF